VCLQKKFRLWEGGRSENERLVAKAKEVKRSCRKEIVGKKTGTRRARKKTRKARGKVQRSRESTGVKKLCWRKKRKDSESSAGVIGRNPTVQNLGKNQSSKRTISSYPRGGELEYTTEPKTLRQKGVLSSRALEKKLEPKEEQGKGVSNGQAS